MTNRRPVSAEAPRGRTISGITPPGIISRCHGNDPRGRRRSGLAAEDPTTYQTPRAVRPPPMPGIGSVDGETPQSNRGRQKEDSFRPGCSVIPVNMARHSGVCAGQSSCGPAQRITGCQAPFRGFERRRMKDIGGNHRRCSNPRSDPFGLQSGQTLLFFLIRRGGARREAIGCKGWW